MLSRIISTPFVLAGLVFLYLTWEVDEGYSIYIVPMVITLALIYVFSPEIDWWWYKRNPPKLDKPIRQLFQQHLSFYQQLAPDEQQRFRNRVALFIIANDFMSQAMGDVPEDLKAFVAASAVQMTFYQEEFLFKEFEKIVIYPKPFPSPQYPEQFHASEIFQEDGVLLFSAEQLAKGVLHPKQFYNLGLHEYAKVYKISYPDKPWPKVGSELWESLEAISGFSKEVIHKWINLENIDAFPVSVAHFFVFPERFREVLPELYEVYAEIFGKKSSS